MTDIRKHAADRSSWAGGLWSTIRLILEVVIIAGLINTFVFRIFHIPSGSLIPTLLVNDYILVSKYAYGYSRHSIPFAPPLFEGRIFGAVPKRGELIVFKNPKDEGVDFIKRVIGLPGDKVQVRGGVLYLNGAMVRRERVQDYEAGDPWGRTSRVPMFRESLPGGVSYFVIEINGDRGPFDDTAEVTVPPGMLFLMGDNRDNSSDSRDTAAVGLVPVDNVVGRAEVIVFSVNEASGFLRVWEWPWALRPDRFFRRP
jgi:signal peptidase I